MIDTDRYDGLTNDGKWRGTDADDSVIYYDAERDDYCTIALVMRDSDHYGTEDNPDIRLMVDAPLLLEEVKRLRERIYEFEIAVRDMIPMWDPGDYDEVQINGKQKIMVDADWWWWMHTHIDTLLFPYRYHVEGKRYNHETCEWEEEE